ncbi:hypothetical protein [Profundibacterium mesophilum]|uniref:Uncharacterized protein n=1 Tax=Profundibacterium mesophilum KAUST100406-0324 TaxID=1037889 RepID=A0A921NUI7_9RHOB|nr:hypothetical protein [Profundibacterium mesophilum]KAF0675491.1 hypothetical protein PMES_02121 [Profundibacterium mesophilum KAUST100406-0324]
MHRQTLPAAAVALALGLLPVKGDAGSLDLGGIFTSLMMVGTMGAAVERRVIAQQLSGPAMLRQAALNGTPDRNGRHVVPKRDGQLPPACMREVPFDGTAAQVFSKSCLEREMVDADRLPRHCTARVPGTGRERTVYHVDCLSKAGWRAL